MAQYQRPAMARVQELNLLDFLRGIKTDPFLAALSDPRAAKLEWAWALGGGEEPDEDAEADKENVPPPGPRRGMQPAWH